MHKLSFLLFVFLFFFASLGADPSNEMNSTENFLSGDQESLSTVMNCVNVITGTFFQVDTDLIVDGPEPLRFTRCYDSGHLLASDYGFGFGSQFPLRVRSFRRGKTCYHAAIETQEGSYMEFYGHSNENQINFSLDPKIKNKGLTNYSEFGISAHTNADNINIKLEDKEKWCVSFPDGRSRNYTSTEFLGDKGAKLDYEQHPNGIKTYFTCDASINLPDNLKGLYEVYNLTSGNAKFNWINTSKTENGYKVTGSNGQSVTYKTHKEKHSFGHKSESKEYDLAILTEVSAPHLPTTKYHIDTTGKERGFCKIDRVEKPDGRVLRIIYNNKGKVLRLIAPIGIYQSLYPLYTFDYDSDGKFTTVTNALGAKTRYHTSKEKRLTLITRYQGNIAYSSKSFFWNKKGWLLGKASRNGNNVERAVAFEYDDQGNIKKETFYGNLTGRGGRFFPFNGQKAGEETESYSKYYTYSTDGFNLRLSECDDAGLKTLYSYKPSTNLLTKKLILHHDQIHVREFYEYDANAVLTQTIEDDGTMEDPADLTGVTERRITKIIPFSEPTQACFGKPAEIQKYYVQGGQPVLLQLTKFSYSPHGFPTSKEVYDADMIHRYTETIEYDERDLVVKETDALGQETLYGYDANHNKTFEEQVGSGKRTHYSYDCMNRLTDIKDEHDDGVSFRTRNEYDMVGNRTATTDHYGNRTTYEYDELSRLIRTQYPMGEQKEQKCDFMDRVISSTDERGFTTETQYNSYDKPIIISYPDGSVERFEYYLNGRLHRKWDQEGVLTEYDYDPQGRIIKEICRDKAGNCIEQITKQYKGNHLIAETDPAGNLTEYRYDGAGRRIEEKRHERITAYSYDSLGRLKNKTNQQRVEITEYDALNRPIEERTEDLEGNLFRKVTYAYDRSGNKTDTHTYLSEDSIAEEHTAYNPRGEPILHVDAMGHKTTISYNYKGVGRQKRTKDPLGVVTIETCDAYQRPISIKVKTKHNDTVAHQEIQYDAAGNKTMQIEHVYANGLHDRDYVVEWNYDAMGRISELKEEGSKVTTYTYYPTGRLKKLIKPDGVTLRHTYNPNGLLETLTSSDNSIAYTYTYDSNHNPIKITDHNSTNSRTYNVYDELTKETLGNGLTTEYEYDQLGRAVLVRLPDQTTIEYRYDADHMTAVCHKDRAQTVVFEETYEAFDMMGHPGRRCSENVCVEFQWDKLGRRISAQSPGWSETLDAFDKKGNLLKWRYKDEQGEVYNRYKYDALDQLISENEHVYKYDSLYNRLQRDEQIYSVNGFNQYENDTKADYRYDHNGNLNEKIEGEERQKLTYDALNRLTSVTIPEGIIKYRYDSDGRCLTREVTKGGEDGEVSTLSFVYQFNTEIGAIDENQKLRQLRILGLNIGAQIGPTVAVELDQKVYVALSDHIGSIRSLIDMDQNICETYRYSAFGESYGHGELLEECPWGFNNKRVDADTGYLRFAKRDYSPDLGRWLTTDPLNFDDGLNLYAYVRNNPLIYEDPYGLFMTSMGSENSFCQPLFSFSQGFSSNCARGFIDPNGTMKQPLSLNKLTAAHDYEGVCNYLDNRSLQFGEYAGAICGTSLRELANLYVMGKVMQFGYAVGSRFLKPSWNILSTQLVPSVGKPITAEFIKDVGKGGMGEVAKTASRKRFSPNPLAEGAHTVFRRDPLTGKVSHYETFRPQTNLRNPNPWESVKRFDGPGSEKHYNKVLDKDIYAPHVHDPACEGGIRPPYSWEMPNGYL